MTATRRYFGEWTTSECRGDQHDDLHFSRSLHARGHQGAVCEAGGPFRGSRGVVRGRRWSTDQLVSVHFSDVTARADDVSSLGESRHCGCEYLRSDFDPRVRPLQPWGGGWSNLWSLSAQDRWAWFIRKKLKLNPKSPPGLKRWNSPNLPARAGPIHVCFRGNSGRRISSW